MGFSSPVLLPSPPPDLEPDHYIPVNAVVLLGITWQLLTALPQSAMFLLRLCTLNINLSNTVTIAQVAVVLGLGYLGFSSLVTSLQ